MHQKTFDFGSFVAQENKNSPIGEAFQCIQCGSYDVTCEVDNGTECEGMSIMIIHSTDTVYIYNDDHQAEEEAESMIAHGAEGVSYMLEATDEQLAGLFKTFPHYTLERN